MEAKEILGLDVGSKRTGMARASNVARLAEPLTSIPTKDAISSLQKYLAEHRVEAIAVGLPRNLAGEDTDQTRWVRSWIDKAKPKIAAPIYWQDEALTSKKAESLKLKAKSNQLIAISSPDEHALAAAIILQDFLDSAETNRMIA